MMYMIMGGLVLIGIGFTILIMNRFQQTESVYFREYGKRAKGRAFICPVSPPSASRGKR